MQLMSEFYGSAQLTPYEAKDVSNFRSTIRKTEKFKDMQQALDHFRVLREEDPVFFYKFKLDDEHRFQNLFWADSASRHAYIESYHDCVSFDATYMTNLYDMPFAPFIGINRYGTIGPFLAGNQELEEEFTDCIDYTVTPEEFETKWQCFVPAYYMHCFFPFLQSTQSSEGFNALLKKYVNPNMSILHFVEQKIQDKCLVAQDGQDFRTDEKERRRWSRYLIEKHAATVYTKNLFYRFSKEFEKTADTTRNIHFYDE
ncbi:protein FAR-RED IMPAIRED RESPONSE 1-like [Miscanthus floridulus]|uniref:protein FAR-RED IMPAIRED RESPONSE 1-like n=1 Tax=Miscanthus floridulus TaxID=154761 RepID=UPI003459E601